AAAALDLSPQTARRLAANGELPAEKAGRDWLIDAESVAARGLAGSAFKELATAEAEAAEYDAIVAARPGDVVAARRASWARGQAERVRARLRAMGIEP